MGCDLDLYAALVAAFLLGSLSGLALGALAATAHLDDDDAPASHR